MHHFPRTLFVETTTHCNLACPMCVKNGPGWRGGEGHMAWDTFQRLAPAFAQARAVILNGIGEPLMHPELPRMTALASSSQPADGWCGLQTNGLLLDPPLARELVRAGLDVLCLSVDGLSPDGPASVGADAGLGHGAGQEGVAARAAALLREAAAPLGRSLRLGVELVLMRSNVKGLPRMVDWAARAGLDFLLVTHMLPSSPEQEAEGLFQSCSRAALEHYAGYGPRLAAHGLDMARLTKATTKYRQNDSEKRLLALARQMHREAHEKGVWLNLNSLARTDFEELRGLETLFAEARTRARDAGLDLRLPALTAPAQPDQRRCPFVERDSACVDWLGGVAPCHFLWHGYQCSIYGEKSSVHAVRFGDVRGTALEDIWGSQEFREFRRHAREAEYAACGDCSIGMCSDANGVAGPFEMDCLGVPVPCGHCPWSVGQLMCLGSEPPTA